MWTEFSEGTVYNRCLETEQGILVQRMILLR